MSGSPRYRFGPLERRGLVAGWRGGQIVSVALGLLLAVAALRARSTGVGVPMALGAVAGSIGFACWPLGGRTAEEWTPTVVRWLATGASGGRGRRSGAPGAGRCTGADGRPCAAGVAGPSGSAGIGGPASPAGPAGGPARPAGPPGGARPAGPPADGMAPRLGGTDRASGAAAPSARSPGRRRSKERSARPAGKTLFDGLQILGVRWPGEGPRPLSPTSTAGEECATAVVHDRRAGTFTAVLGLGGRSFALLGPEEQDHRVRAWAGVLASLARERPTVHRLQWLASALPDDGQGVREHLRRRAVLPPTAAPHRGYERLLDEIGASTCRHEVLLAVQVRPNRVGGRPGGWSGACATLLREVGGLRRLLADADVDMTGVLGPRALTSVLRRCGAPGPAPSGPERCPPCGVAWPWPLATRATWDRVRADGAWHAVYWVAEWPRVEVAPDFLGPLLLGSVRRSVSMVMEPLAPSRALRQVEQARTADVADSELRRRGGFLATARRSREAELVVRREAELADGHASFRFSGYVTVTAPSTEALDEACEATEQAAAQSRLELRRLFGEQDRALLHGMPLCRGLV